MEPSTGIPSLDKVLCGMRPGDNVVWQMHSIDDYLAVIEPFVANSLAHDDGKLVYFRFAKHKELVPRGAGVEVHNLRPEDGLEQFVSSIRKVIHRVGRGGRYVFDSLSELVLDCYSERMLGNFFMLTCPLLRSFDTIAYFAVLKDYHSYFAALPISKTTQLLLDVYKHENRMYIHPMKVSGRHSPSMYMLHAWDEDDLIPITDSTTISNVVTTAPWPGLQSASYRMVGMWDRRFMRAEKVLESHLQGECSQETVDEMVDLLLPQLITRDQRMLAIAQRYLTLSDLIYIWKRMIGSGLIGGKAVGMLLARAILRNADPAWSETIEAHDSFYIGSDIFYSFLVENGCWEVRQKQKNPATFLEGATEARQRIRDGVFPDYIVKRFSDMLDHFGQSPIIVRSSSLLEDNFGSSFAGKYDSIFCASQGTRQQRLEEFLNAVRDVYSSAMNEEALTYRAQRGVLHRDEQMALLVQRVSGDAHENRFFPAAAGVAASYNPYRWDKSIDPDAGMLRLVCGLGTRAVDRHDDEYTRLVSLNAPTKCPEQAKDKRRYAQKRVDVLNLRENRFASCSFDDIAAGTNGVLLEMLASRDRQLEQNARNAGLDNVCPWTIDFHKLLSKTEFVGDMGRILQVLRNAYDEHLEVEFTVNFTDEGRHRINVVQCRPFQVIPGGNIEPVSDETKQDAIMVANGAVVGSSREVTIDRLVYVAPSVYGQLPVRDRHATARLIGRIMQLEDSRGKNIMLLGPGRWGTSMPSLGVPVSFAEITRASVICEIDSMHDGLKPDLSLGTHFFHELVERDMAYIGFFGSRKGNSLNEHFLKGLPNLLSDLLPEASDCSDTVRVIDAPPGKKITLSADSLRQEAVVYLAPERPENPDNRS
jgi:pyruvate,water dikinase